MLGIAASSPGLRATATAALEYSTERLEQELAACAAANIFEACGYRKLDSAILVVKAPENWV